MKDEAGQISKDLPRYFTVGSVVLLVLLFSASVVADLRAGSPGRPLTFFLGSMVGAALGLHRYRQSQNTGKDE